MLEVVSHFSPEYTAHIAQDYGDSIADQLQHWRSADLPEQPGEFIQYVRLNAQADPDRRPLLLVQGFAAGVVANGPFGADMASRGYDIIVTEQNRSGGHLSLGTTTGWQARNLMAIVEAENLTQTPLDVITHSYGSLIFDELEQRAKKAGWHCFDGSKVAMMAPSGVIEGERFGDFMRRYIEQSRAGEPTAIFDDGYYAYDDEMTEAGKNCFLSNPTRALCEGWRIIHDRVDYERLLQTVGEIAIVPFGEDMLFTDEKLYPEGMEDRLDTTPIGRFDGRVLAFTPVSPLDYGDGTRGFKGSYHDDQQSNPARVGGAIDTYLRQPRRI